MFRSKTEIRSPFKVIYYKDGKIIDPEPITLEGHVLNSDGLHRKIQKIGGSKYVSMPDIDLVANSKGEVECCTVRTLEGLHKIIVSTPGGET